MLSFVSCAYINHCILHFTEKQQETQGKYRFFIFIWTGLYLISKSIDSYMQIRTGFTWFQSQLILTCKFELVSLDFKNNWSSPTSIIIVFLRCLLFIFKKIWTSESSTVVPFHIDNLKQSISMGTRHTFGAGIFLCKMLLVDKLSLWETTCFDVSSANVSTKVIRVIVFDSFYAFWLREKARRHSLLN